jgi:signal peptidase I
MLSQLCPGLGHLYAGAPRRAAVALVAMGLATAALLSAAVLLADRAGFVLQVVGLCAAWELVAADAFRTARRAPTAYQLRWFNHGLIYLAVFGAVGVASFAWHLVVDRVIATRMRIPTDTMAPTLVAGDHVYAVSRWGAAVRRGEIVVYRKWGTGYVKRVVGLPGDTVAMVAGVLSVDGRVVSEPYASHVGEGELTDRQFAWQRAFVPDSLRTAYTPTLATWGPLVVPPATYFVLGDNRGQSMDSRYHGVVADTEVVARPVMISYSVVPRTLHLRWGRFGRHAGP